MSAVIFWTVVVIVAMCLHVHLKNKNKKIEQMFPALPRLPFLGNLLSLIRSREGKTKEFYLFIHCILDCKNL